jgi:hypothetical protein
MRRLPAPPIVPVLTARPHLLPIWTTAITCSSVVLTVLSAAVTPRTPRTPRTRTHLQQHQPPPPPSPSCTASQKLH